jgi:hypothetical protein
MHGLVPANTTRGNCEPRDAAIRPAATNVRHFDAERRIKHAATVWLILGYLSLIGSILFYSDRHCRWTRRHRGSGVNLIAPRGSFSCQHLWIHVGLACHVNGFRQAQGGLPERTVTTKWPVLCCSMVKKRAL